MTAGPIQTAAPRVPPEARGEGLRVALVGLNAWLVCGVIPVALGTGRPLGAVVSLAGAVIALVAGVFVLSQDGGEGPGGLVLLALFPALLALGIALPPELHAADALSPAAAVVGAMAFVAYGIVAVRAVARPRGTRASTRHALTATPRAVENRAKVFLRRLVVGMVALGAVALVAVAPFVEARELSRAYPGAAGEAAVTAAVVGGVLAALLAGALLGPGLRAVRVTRPVVGRSLAFRVTALLVVASLGGLAYALWRVAQ